MTEEEVEVIKKLKLKHKNDSKVKWENRIKRVTYHPGGQ